MNNEDKITIVVVDDHQIFLDGMIAILNAQKNFKLLFTETSPVNALLKLNNLLPDIIITDISMPDMNGVEFIKKVKKKFPQIKILVISMYENQQTFDGIDGYLLKETNKKILVEAIKEIVLNGKKYNITNQKNINNFNFNKNILSPKEKEIIRFISNQHTTDQIAEKLEVSKSTIESHKKNIFLKLNVNSVAGLIKKAIYLGVIK